MKLCSTGALLRRAVLIGLAVAALPFAARAQANWPDRPIRLIVPFAPGGSNDNIARILAVKLSARLGQSVVVDNRGGAGGTIGTNVVVNAQPDGYTLLLASVSIVTNAASGKKLPYDPVKDLQPIGLIGAGPFAVVVSNKVPATTLKEFLALARAKPNTINYGSAGVGGINHLGTELFANAAKIQMVHVPYKGIGPAFSDLIAGNIQMLLPSLASSVQHIHGGTMRGLAVTSAQRSPLAPELPTVSEAGVPGFELEAWWGLMGPPKLPAAIVERVNRELNAILVLPDVRELLVREGATPKPGAPDALGALVRADFPRWRKLVMDAHIQTE